MSLAQPGQTLALTAELHASPDRVFDALTDPLELPRWWGPRGFTTEATELDLRVGGRYRLTMKPPDGPAFHLAGEFRDIRRPAGLVYTFRWEEPSPDDRETVVTIALGRDGEATMLSLLQRPFATTERLELHRNGWTDAFAKLRLLFEAQAQPSQPSGGGLA